MNTHIPVGAIAPLRLRLRLDTVTNLPPAVDLRLGVFGMQGEDLSIIQRGKHAHEPRLLTSEFHNVTVDRLGILHLPSGIVFRKGYHEQVTLRVFVTSLDGVQHAESSEFMVCK